MKQEIIAAVILVALIVFGILNIGYVDRRVDELLSDVESIAELSQSGQSDAALERAKASAETWETFSVYAGVMLRHSDEITDVSESYFDIEEALEKGEAPPEAMFEKLRHGLTDIATTESLTLSSLF